MRPGLSHGVNSRVLNSGSGPASSVDFMPFQMLSACQTVCESVIRPHTSWQICENIVLCPDSTNLCGKTAQTSTLMKDFKKLSLDDTFQFSCHSGILCFNRCCGDLNQFLTPYDILRLKQGLKLSSGEFLKRHTTHHIGPGSGLPIVTLKMQEHENLSCPFVSKTGCTVYQDRPGSCRIYPLARIIQRRKNQHTCEEFHVVIQEAHCLGFEEPKKWTVREWKKSQAVEPYDEMNDLLMEIISLKNRSGRKRLEQQENELFYLACYDLDRYRDFVFEKRLWEAYPIEEKVLKDLDDDVALMQFGIEWIKGRLFGDIIGI
jgi:Fe-S-cluster containining protein